jgi:hypothetical protein
MCKYILRSSPSDSSRSEKQGTVCLFQTETYELQNDIIFLYFNLFVYIFINRFYLLIKIE